MALLSLVGVAPASAAEGDEYPFHFLGNVKYQDEPLEGVRMTVEGNGFTNETETDVDGKWDLGVPEGGSYTITLDESTLPDGVVVAEGKNPVEAEFGVTNRSCSSA
jgi:neutral amino acid transport system permease protein